MLTSGFLFPDSANLPDTDNITHLNRYGASGLSEMLSFTHAGNRLSSVQSWDGENLPQIGTFTYDAMGNQLPDSPKALQFCYNFANLPSKVEGMSGPPVTKCQQIFVYLRCIWIHRNFSDLRISSTS